MYVHVTLLWYSLYHNSPSCVSFVLEIRDHPFLMGTSLDEFRSKYPGKNVCIFFCAVYLVLL